MNLDKLLFPFKVFNLLAFSKTIPLPNGFPNSSSFIRSLNHVLVGYVKSVFELINCNYASY